MRSVVFSLLLALPLLVSAGPEEERKEAQEMRQQVLADLYKEKPGSKAEIEKSKGYAVFSNLGVNLFVVSTARGGGILRDNRDGKDTYMSMFSAGGGIGLGLKNFSAVFIFISLKDNVCFKTNSAVGATLVLATVTVVPRWASAS